MGRDEPWASVPGTLDPATNAVALTFDDGPDPTYTPQVLAELRRLNVRATFFLVGERVDAHPTVARDIVAAGHAVGSHSHRHPEPWTVGPLALLADYRNGRRALERAVGRTRLFRPPKGFVSRAGKLAMRAAGVRPWLWSIDTEDWRPEVRPAEIAAAAGDLRSGDVLLLHDGICGPLAPAANDRSATVKALPALVQRARQQGLELVTLS